MAKKVVPLEDCMIHPDEDCTCVNERRVKGLYSKSVNAPERPVPGVLDRAREHYGEAMTPRLEAAARALDEEVRDGTD